METKYMKAQYSIWSPYLLVLKRVNFRDKKIVSYKGLNIYIYIYIYHQMNPIAKIMCVYTSKKSW